MSKKKNNKPKSAPVSDSVSVSITSASASSSATTSSASAAASSSAADPSLAMLERQSIGAMESALAAVRDLSDARLAAKLSVARLVGVARELRELIKVMSIYGA